MQNFFFFFGKSAKTRENVTRQKLCGNIFAQFEWRNILTDRKTRQTITIFQTRKTIFMNLRNDDLAFLIF